MPPLTIQLGCSRRTWNIMDPDPDSDPQSKPSFGNRGGQNSSRRVSAPRSTVNKKGSRDWGFLHGWTLLVTLNLLRNEIGPWAKRLS